MIGKPAPMADDELTRKDAEMGRLLPCPFCGTYAEVVYESHIRCANIFNCDAETRLGATAWNRRQALSPESAREEERTKAKIAVHYARIDALEEAARLKVGDELLYGHVTEAWLARAIRALQQSPARVAEGVAVPEGELRWLIERTYAKGQPAERREFWLGVISGDTTRDSFDFNAEIWTTNALEAARFSSQKIAESLRYRHFHPEAPVDACGHMFQCGISPESPAKEQPGEQNAAPQTPSNGRGERDDEVRASRSAVAAPDVAAMVKRLEQFAFHLRTIENQYAETMREKIDRDAAETGTSIAKCYGITQSMVSAIKRGIRWKHLTQA